MECMPLITTKKKEGHVLFRLIHKSYDSILALNRLREEAVLPVQMDVNPFIHVPHGIAEELISSVECNDCPVRRYWTELHHLILASSSR